MQMGDFDIIIGGASLYENFTEASFLICFNKMLKSGGRHVIGDCGVGYRGAWPVGKVFMLSDRYLIYRLKRRYIQNKEYEVTKKMNYECNKVGWLGL